MKCASCASSRSSGPRPWRGKDASPMPAEESGGELGLSTKKRCLFAGRCSRFSFVLMVNTFGFSSGEELRRKRNVRETRRETRNGGRSTSASQKSQIAIQPRISGSLCSIANVASLEHIDCNFSLILQFIHYSLTLASNSSAV